VLPHSYSPEVRRYVRRPRYSPRYSW